MESEEGSPSNSQEMSTSETMEPQVEAFIMNHLGAVLPNVAWLALLLQKQTKVFLCRSTMELAVFLDWFWMSLLLNDTQSQNRVDKKLNLNYS